MYKLKYVIQVYLLTPTVYYTLSVRYKDRSYKVQTIHSLLNDNTIQVYRYFPHNIVTLCNYNSNEDNLSQ